MTLEEETVEGVEEIPPYKLDILLDSEEYIDIDVSEDAEMLSKQNMSLKWMKSWPNWHSNVVIIAMSVTLIWWYEKASVQDVDVTAMEWTSLGYKMECLQVYTCYEIG